MPRPRLPLLAAAVVIACVAFAAALADDVDDAVKTVTVAFNSIQQNEYEKIYGARVAKNGKLYFLCQTHYVGIALDKEKGWEVPEKDFTFEPALGAGPVFWSQWSSGLKAEPDPTVRVVVWRYPLKSGGGGDGASKFGDAEVPHADAPALVKALFQEWTARLETPADAPAADDAAAADRKEWTEPVKKQVGIAKVYAAAQGRLTDAKARQRREWFAWTGADATFVVVARYPEAVLSKTNPARTKGAYFTNAVRRED